MERAVSNALDHWRPPFLADSSQLETRIDALERDLAEVKLSLLQERQVAQPPELSSELKQEPVSHKEPEPEPTCSKAPTPMPADQAPHQRPEVLACARSCLQLRDQGGAPLDGVYWFTGMPVPVYCDFSHDGGGWTLLLTAVSRAGWDVLSVLSRNHSSPSLTENYSILHYADTIRDLGTGRRFAYRIETQAEKGRQQWGGVWLAPRSYSFVHESPSQTDVAVVRKFNGWNYHDNGIERRMPWVHTAGGQPAVLTTSASPSSSWWGTMVTFHGSGGFDHSPWIHPESTRSGTVLYWIREELL
ncbi:hypothetical protein FJT64_027450 [Amphibalanus amphitrite]|uniref:Fibrinogen C-terminal domain-containing protein n=1 Tax=Amphibalanus amphitrite TaxID=1232801 RepID=A0A6A4W0G8_AMPAM|nr:hypothetical protein FJT64_027450 [Amphibalanus amphitrite]